MFDVLRGRQLLFNLRCTEDHCFGHAQVSRCRFLPRCAEIDNLRQLDSLHVRAFDWHHWSASSVALPVPPICAVSRFFVGQSSSTWATTVPGVSLQQEIARFLYTCLHVAAYCRFTFPASLRDTTAGSTIVWQSSMTTMSPVCVWLPTSHYSAGGTACPGSAPCVAASVCPSLTITTKAQPHLHNSGTEGLKAEPSAKPSRGTRGSPSLSTGTALP